MKKYIPGFFKVIFFISVSFVFIGCKKDTCTRTHSYTWYEPLYKTTEEVRANIKSNSPRDIKEPGKIFILGKYIFLNEINKGIHIIDNSNPSSPKNISFVDIPGNVDMAVKGNTLYADFYTDLVTLDISNPLNVIKKNISEGVFPDRSYYGFSADSGKVIYDWVKHDTTVEDCNGVTLPYPGGVVYFDNAFAFQSSSKSSPVGIAGSMARFALVNNYLYTVGYSDITVFNITNATQPVFANKLPVGWNVETIYPFKNKLFIGSNSGMFIYDVTASPENPSRVGEFSHVSACDPVIADDNYAYVTLHSGTACLGYENQLDIVKLNNLSNAQLAKTYNLTNPHGLSKDGNLLFICDGTAGLKIYDAKNILNLQLLQQISGLETYDVIAYNKKALVVASDGLYQYDYSNARNIHLLSKMNLAK